MRSRTGSWFGLAALAIIAATPAACSGGGATGNGDGERVTSPTPTVPTAPTALAVAVISLSEIDLTWTDASANEDGFRIERCSSNGCSNFTEIGTVGAGATAYENTGLAAATSYTYRIRAYNTAGASTYSNTSSATTPPSIPVAPSNLTAVAASSTQINLNWTRVSTNEDGFLIERCGGSACVAFAEIASVGAGVTAYENRGLAPSTVYTYRVRAFNVTGASAYSNGSSSTTLSSGAVTSWAEFSMLFPFVRTSGSLEVRSDLSQPFTDAHLDMLLRTWTYFTAEIGRSPGPGTMIHYTTDSARYVSHGPLCPHIGAVVWYRDARQTSACWNVPAPGRWTWVVIPYNQPDFGTILHEIGHTFSQTVFPAQEDYPWFKEGTGMYWEGAEPATNPATAFDAAGNLIVDKAAAYTITGFRRWDGANQLFPLRTLVTMPRSEFYGNNDWSRQYSQAGMFILFLAKTYPGILADVWSRMRGATIVTNAQLLAFVEARTGSTIESLEAAYLAFARR